MIYGQISAMLSIVLIGLYVFNKHPLKFQVKTLVQVSLWVVLSVLLGLFSWMVPVLGFPALKIGLSQLPLMIIGLVFGPAWAFLAGIVTDAIELLSGTIALPFFGFTLNKILVAVIPALLMQRRKPLKENILFLGIGAFSLSALMYVLTVSQVKLGDALVDVDGLSRLSVSALIVVLSGSLMAFIHRFQKRSLVLPFNEWVAGILLVELVVQLMLTPIWLFSMYGLPIQVSVVVRLVKSVVMIPVNVFLGAFILDLLKRLKAF